MTTSPLVAGAVRRAGDWSGAADLVTLDYDGRFVRRKRLRTAGGQEVMVDLAQATGLEHGDALVLADGTLVEVVAAEEDLAEVRPGGAGAGLARLAWHIGNRHTPCQIEEARLVIRRDPVLEGMLRGLGAGIAHVVEPFVPEGGAYGTGRTMGHDHGPGAAGHGDAHGDEDEHGHAYHLRVHHHSSHGAAGEGDEPADADV